MGWIWIFIERFLTAENMEVYVHPRLGGKRVREGKHQTGEKRGRKYFLYFGTMVDGLRWKVEC